MTMRWMRVLVVAAFAVKLTVVGTWWWTTAAQAEAESPPPAAKPAAGTTGVSADLFEKSRGFRELLDAVRVRGEELDRREQALAAREAAVKAVEEVVGKDAPRAPGAPAPAAAPASADGPCSVAVTKIYQSMKAEEAAPVLAALDDGTALTIFGCMKERQIGAILAAMPRDRAAALTKALVDAGGGATS
jgi:flagellar motility protein MotE (MotC chaperone)